MTTLQETARVYISPQTMERANRPLVRRQRNDVKRKRIIEYVRDLEPDQLISMRDIWQAVDPGVDVASMYQMVGRLVRDGIINRKQFGSKYLFTLPQPGSSFAEAPIDTTRRDVPMPVVPATPEDNEDTPDELPDVTEAIEDSGDERPSVHATPRAQDKPQVPYGTLEQKAMQFSWEHPENHNDLRKFIVWLSNN